MTRVATFEIEHTRFLREDGTLERPLPTTAPDRATLTELYRGMVLLRTFDAKAIALQRTGQLGTYAPTLGQEAVGVGIGHVMRPEDVLVPSFREEGAQLLRGVTLRELFLFWGGDERGSDFAGPREDFPVSITVGGHAPHATGAAMAFKLRGEPRVAVCVFGDGATSKGDVYEAMNLAGLWALPIVFVVTNNCWAISVPRSGQSAAETLAQKAIAAGFTGEQVDGNDVIAVVEVVGGAVERARTGGGPHLVECLTYRLGDHTTADDASRYRNDAEVSEAWQHDPLARMRTYLSKEGGWGRAEEEALLATCRSEVEAAAQAYLDTPPQPPETMFDFLFENLPAPLRVQRGMLGTS